MITEWLLIVWIGTTTNFTLINHYGTKDLCQKARQEIVNDFKAPMIVDCITDFREGRSQLPPRGYQGGLVK